MREQYIRNGRGFLLVYSVTDEQSFRHARQLYQQVLRVKDVEAYPVLLVANKVDLVSHRRVTEAQGRQLADELNLSYIETSAKEPPLNVESSFLELVRIMKQFHARSHDIIEMSHYRNEGANNDGKPRRKTKHKCAIM